MCVLGGRVSEIAKPMKEMCHMQLCFKDTPATDWAQLFPDASQVLGRVHSKRFACCLRTLLRLLAMLMRLVGIIAGGSARCVVFPVPGFCLLL